MFTFIENWAIEKNMKHLKKLKTEKDAMIQCFSIMEPFREKEYLTAHDRNVYRHARRQFYSAKRRFDYHKIWCTYYGILLDL